MSAHGAGRSPTGAFAPTHEAPAGGIPAWDAPDSARPAATTINAGVRFTVAERQGDWARVVCSNGWSAWVDGRRVVAVSSVAATARPSAAEGQPRQSLRARASAWLNSWQPPANWPPWLSRAIGIGPLLGAGLAGALLYIPSHSFGQSFKTGFLSLVVIGGLRALDPSLKPVWAQLDRIPRGVRIGAGIVIPIWFSISQFGPSAAGNEVNRAQTALLVSSAVAFVLLRPPEQKQ